MSPTKRNPEKTRQAILDAAESLFSDRGYSAASAADIAGQANVTKSLLHHHFGAKSNLWNVVMARVSAGYQEIDEPAEPTDWGDPIAVRSWLGELTDARFSYLISHPSVLRLMSWRQLEDTSSEALAEPSAGALVQNLQRAKDAGGIGSDAPAAHLAALIYGGLEHWILSREINTARFGDNLAGEDADGRHLSGALSALLDSIVG